METIRRILIAWTIFALATVGFVWLRGRGSESYGLVELALGEPAPARSGSDATTAVGFTPSSLAPLGANEVPFLSQLDAEYSKLADRAIPSVVSISTIRSGNIPQLYLGPSGLQKRNQQFQNPGLGSGVIVSREGHVLTNHHVINGVDGIQVTAHDGEAYRASIIGSDPILDIAVLKIDSERDDFPTLPFGDSDEIRVGQSIIAVGNPFGLTGTVTRGIVSAKGRTLSDGTPDLIQTDAVINPGNSGGPLINTRGEIIGINVAIYKGQQDLNVWQGVALAIPANSVDQSFRAIMQRGRPIFGYLGITVGREVVSGGIAVTGITKGSPAETAQLRLGDLILEFDGRRPKRAEDFLRSVLRSSPGEEVDLLVLRGNEEIPLRATMAERPSQTPTSEELPTEQAVTSIRDALGITCRNLTRTEVRRSGTFPASPGVLVKALELGSPFQRVLRKGDLIMQVNQLPVGDVNSLWEAVSNLPRNKQATLYVIANGKRQALRFVPDEGQSKAGSTPTPKAKPGTG